ncbi:MATE family efflux transporter [Sphingomonas astaxanthinifaciens]|uniref:Multidrug-efflux transporter n=1 Tax=Sphingomonas astaxanthinifaciens DSM 22298 TaxID=1123267 RepID=A0ABQ5Z8Q0_9SPHN|nr:MATE family efflux transporter [Sphingomonas astaxanthinifaciens]GLR47238.1 MATE family efflux transporter [Sphingomonas astaxanthinifaciens DSM 22298]
MPALPTAPRTTREEVGATLRLAGPLVLSNLAATAITTTDVLMLGRLGPEPLAASALAVNLYNLLLFTGVGFSVAISPMIASALGRRKGAARDSRRSFRMGLWLVTFYAIAATILLSFAEGIFRAFGQDPALSVMAGQFMDIVRWALWPTLLAFVMRNLLTAFDRAWIPLGIALGGVVLNIFLNYALIFGHFGLPALGLEGSAFATLITNIFMLAAQALAVAFLPRLRMMHLFGHWWRSDWARFKELARLGIPIGLTWSFEVGVFSAAVYLMGLIDTISVAAHVIALQIAALMFMVPLGLSQAATVRVGYGHGAADPRWIARAGKAAIGLAAAFAAASALVMWIFPRELALQFLDSTKPESAAVLATAVQFLMIAAVFQLADGMQVIGVAILRGLHDTRVPMLFAALGYWGIGIGTGAWLAFKTPLAGRGIWIGLAVGLAAVAVLMLWRWSRREALGLVPPQSSTQTGVPTAVTA